MRDPLKTLEVSMARFASSPGDREIMTEKEKVGEGRGD